MGEVDTIIINILAQSGSAIPAEVKTFASFDSPVFVSSVGHCLRAIQGRHAAQAVPTQLPESKAGRFRVCQTLSQIIKDLGYSGEVGFHLFLYPAEGEVRKLLSWLVGQLPTAVDADDAQDLLEPDALFHVALHQSVKSFCSTGGASAPPAAAPFSTGGPIGAPFSLALLSRIPPTKLVPSVVEYHTRSVARSAIHDAFHVTGERGDAQSRQQQQPPVDAAAARRQAKATFSDSQLGSLITSLDQSASSISSGGGATLAAANVTTMDAVAEMFAAAWTSSRTLGQLGGGQASDSAGKSAGTAGGSGGPAEAGADGGSGTQKLGSTTQAAPAPAAAAAAAAASAAELLELERAQTLSSLQDDLAQAVDNLQTLHDKHSQDGSTHEGLVSALAAQQASRGALEDKIKRVAGAVKLLPQAADNIQKLQTIVEATKSKVAADHREWDAFCVSKESQATQAKHARRDRLAAAESALEEIKASRVEQRRLAQDTKVKQVKLKVIAQDLEKLPKSINRQAYVQRIMDTVSKLVRQKDEIRRLLVDIRQIQHEINTSADTCGRQFAVVDETLFRAAQAAAGVQPGGAGSSSGSKPKPSGASSQTQRDFNAAYQHLADFQEAFDALIDKSEETGRVRNDVRSLEHEIEQLASRQHEFNDDRIRQDLKQVKKENSTLRHVLKKAAAV